MEAALKTYLDKCRTIFNAHHSMSSNVIPIAGNKEFIKDNRDIFEKAMTNAEDTKEFNDLIGVMGTGPLASDLERIIKKEQEHKKNSKNTHQLDKLRQETARQAAKGFFRNTGTYVNLWLEKIVKESELVNILVNYQKQKDSELIRLFVFDGFIPSHDRKRLNNIELPVGEFKKYSENEIEVLFRLPQSLWHGIVKPEIINEAANWQILTIKVKDEYRGFTGVWLDGVLLDFDLGKYTIKENDIGIIGPIFLCIGEDANLAVEIRVRTNIFEYFPIDQWVRNNYLPWDSYDEEGEPKPRTFVKDIGKDGNKLKKIFEIWNNINGLDAKGHLSYPTDTYVRSLMNLHSSRESLMQTFVSFVTVIESLLTPGTRQELTYKTAMRGAALLTSDPKRRIAFFQKLSDFYQIRSQIVHEGRIENEDSYELISPYLTEISRQIFLRYICLLNIGLYGELPQWILPDSENLSSRGKRPQTIARILDGIILDAKMTVKLEKKMDEWGVYEDILPWLSSKNLN